MIKGDVLEERFEEEQSEREVSWARRRNRQFGGAGAQAKKRAPTTKIIPKIKKKQ